MSTTTFIEATSADPFIRDLHRKAVRLLNDSSLDRRKREFHMRRLQSILIEHQAKQEAKAARLLAKKASREQVSRENRNQGVADPSQVVARRREFGVKATEVATQQVGTGDLPEPVTDGSLEVVTAANAANDSQVPGRARPVLSLKRA
jgi:hypothetical protein